ncbi:MAG: hypothetical protein JWO36_7009 [Myxococcales bacterium]|nr:hypothetical protein [Myxococcales bacterium]
MKRARQAGFTIIELMISLVIASLLVIMILSIFSRLSFAYREQQQIVSVQQLLSAARGAIELDAKQAGLEISQGFKISADGSGVAGVMHSPVTVTNNSTTPDQVAFYYADLSKQAVVTSAGSPTVLTVDSATGFAANDLVVLTTPDTTSFSNPISPTTDARIAKFDACVVQIQSINVNAITFFVSGNWGRALNDHCANASAGVTMMYPFVAHAWRIDTTRAGQGVLQMEPTGNLVTAAALWQDEAYGFTDLQTSTYFYDADATDQDGDGDATRDWYSAAAQKTMTDPIVKTGAFTAPIMMTISLVARTDRDVEGVFTSATPTLTITTNTANNNIGDHDTVTLPSATDTTLMGNRIYRYITFRVDLRNMGVGR